MGTMNISAAIRTLITCKVLLALPLAWSAEVGIQTVTILTDNAYPPYSYEEYGQAKGIYNDILRAASSRLHGYRIVLMPVPWKRGLAKLARGEALALSPPYYRPDERPYIQPYSVPMLTEKLVTYCRTNVLKMPRNHWPADFHNLRFGINARFKLGGEAFWSLVRNGKVTLEEAPNAHINLQKILRNRLDCYINDQLAIQQALVQLKHDGLHHAGDLQEAAILSVETAYVGFTDRDNGRFPYKQDFIKQLNRALVEMQRSGQTNRIVNEMLKQRPAKTGVKGSK